LIRGLRGSFFVAFESIGVEDRVSQPAAKPTKASATIVLGHKRFRNASPLTTSLIGSLSRGCGTRPSK
jgi:hypothetical protein